MDEFNLNDSFEIGTSISKLKNTKNKTQSNNKDLFNLIKDLEDRLDNIETSNTTLDSIQVNPPIIKKNKKVTPQKQNIEKSTCNYNDLIIYIIIFILLNDKFTVGTIYKFPYIKDINSPYPNLILRTLLFGSLVYLYKRFVK